MRVVTPLCLSVGLAAVSLIAAPVSGGHAQDKALRERASKFYDLLVAKQYRQSEMFVAAGDRDTYYAIEKPLIYDYKIKKVTFDKSTRTATLDMESTTKVRRPLLGELTIPLSYLSHWKLEHGVWVWYIPTSETRQTPFGQMTFSKKGLGEENGDSIKKKIADAPTAAALAHAVTASPTSIALGEKPGDTVLITLKNTLAGHVKLVAQDPKSSTFSLELFPPDLLQGGSATLRVKRLTTGPISPNQVTVRVEPTQQEIAIQVR